VASNEGSSLGRNRADEVQVILENQKIEFLLVFFVREMNPLLLSDLYFDL
jgi:hypothetical protein